MAQMTETKKHHHQQQQQKTKTQPNQTEKATAIQQIRVKNQPPIHIINSNNTNYNNGIRYDTIQNSKSRMQYCISQNARYAPA